MAGAGIRIPGQGEAVDTLKGIVARLTNPRGLFENIGASLVTSTQRRFETGKGPDGSPWPPSLRVLAHGGKTLVLSARLLQSITYQASATMVEVGTNVVYAAIHQLGGMIRQAARQASVHFKTDKRSGKRLQGFRKASKAEEHRSVNIGPRVVKMPRRPFVGLDDDDQREIVRITEDFVMEGQR
ncbi:MAG: phage virion morphogenesis protein [Pseudolabrys sp.]